MLQKLNGHKTQIAGVLPFVIAFLVGRGYIQQDLAEMLLMVAGILFAGAVGHHEYKKNQE